MQSMVSRSRYFLISGLFFWAVCFTTRVAHSDGIPPLRPAGAPAPSDVAPAVSEARMLYNAGRELLKARQWSEAADKLTLAAQRAGVENLPFDEQALMYYALGL